MENCVIQLGENFKISTYSNLTTFALRQIGVLSNVNLKKVKN
jgi:hypothetical protein